MIYEIYLNDSVVIVWDDKQVEKYVIYKNHDKYGNYLAGEDEIIGELLPFARDIFKLIISMYKLKNMKKIKMVKTADIINIRYLEAAYMRLENIMLMCMN